MITTVHLLHLITASTLRRCIKSMAMSIAGWIHCLLEYEKDAFSHATITYNKRKKEEHSSPMWNSKFKYPWIWLRYMYTRVVNVYCKSTINLSLRV